MLNKMKQQIQLLPKDALPEILAIVVLRCVQLKSFGDKDLSEIVRSLASRAKTQSRSETTNETNQGG